MINWKFKSNIASWSFFDIFKLILYILFPIFQDSNKFYLFHIYFQNVIIIFVEFL